ncbi:MAG: sugar-binding transcriptional regulator [Janthinobacterium lividum]
MTTVAWLYHQSDVNQSQIASRLGISQSQVSRLLESAVEAGIVRTQVVVPPGLHTDLEQRLADRFGLQSAYVFDATAPDDERAILRDLGEMFAARLLAEPIAATMIGFTSWSRSLEAAVRALSPGAITGAQIVVELLGDVGTPQVQHQAAQLTERLGGVTGAEPRFLRVPGVVPSPEARQMLVELDPQVDEVLELHEHVDLALVGIGSCYVVPPLQAGRNFFTEQDFARARDLGAVAEINLRFIAEDGSPVDSDLDRQVVGFQLHQLRRAATSIALAGGPSKRAAMRAVLRGGWVTRLVTDAVSAQDLLSGPPDENTGRGRPTGHRSIRSSTSTLP